MKKNGPAVTQAMNPKEPVSKEQKKVTDWLRRNVATKKTKFLQAHVVEYFVASKAIDALLNESPWAKEKAKEGQELVFLAREQCVKYMDDLLRHKMFHRAKKIPVMDSKKKSKKDNASGSVKTDTSEVEATPKTAEQKKKRKIRLDMHLDQVFLDSTDAYVWLYDPISWVYWLGGTAIVLGTIAVCMFPLWPPMMRTGVHYLSWGAIGVLLLIMALAVLKYILFGALFVLSGGKLSFWLFPNLTEDVGFFESFMPVYDYTYSGGKKKSKKAKDSDDEEDDDEEEEEEDDERTAAGNKSASEEDDDDSSKKSSTTGKDFELVDKNEDTADEAPSS